MLICSEYFFALFLEKGSAVFFRDSTTSDNKSIFSVSVIVATFSATASKLILHLLAKRYYNTFYGVKKNKITLLRFNKSFIN